MERRPWNGAQRELAHLIDVAHLRRLARMTAPRSTQAAASARKVSVMPRPSRGYSPSSGWPIIRIIPLFVPGDEERGLPE